MRNKSVLPYHGICISLLISGILLFGVKGAAQKHELDIFFDGVYDSNTLNNELMNSFISGGFLDEEIKQRNVLSENINTRFGLILNTGFQYRFKPDSLFGSADWGFSVGFQDMTFVNGSVHQDMVKLALFGNAGFVGEHAFFSNSNLHYLSYQKLNLGLVNHKKGFDFSLGFIKGNDFARGKINEGFLYTESDASHLRLNSDFEYMQSDSADLSPTDFSGMGVSLDFNYYIDIDKSAFTNGAMTLEFSVRDLGFIYWNEGLRNDFEVDETFEGLQINGLDLDNIELQGTNVVDSIQNSLTPGDFITPTPALIQMYLRPRGEVKKIQPEILINHRFVANYRPFIMAGAYYRFTEKFATSLRFAQGGYGNSRGGFALFYNLNNNFTFELHSHNVIGMAYNRASGGALSLLIRSRF